MFDIFFYFHWNAQMKHVHDTLKVLQFSFHPNHSIHCIHTYITMRLQKAEVCK